MTGSGKEQRESLGICVEAGFGVVRDMIVVESMTFNDHLASKSEQKNDVILALPSTNTDLLASGNIQTAMSTKKDASLQSDITKFRHEPDGSFRRAPSVFRSFIEKGGQFEAEKGECTKFCC
jgi:hypothetical protein